MKIGLISCAKEKKAYAAPARELYGPSALFRGALNDLEGRVDVAYVLSAKYGLLSLDEVVEPYDLMLKNASRAYRRDWAIQVLAALKRRHGDLKGSTFEFHAGEAYSEILWPLLEGAGATCTSPVAGLTLGGRMQYYVEQVVRATAEAAPSTEGVRTLSGSPSRWRQRRARRAGASVPGRLSVLKIHVEVWLAAALLHEAGHATFTVARLAEEVERRFGDTRPGVRGEITGHCVANARRHNKVEHSYLVWVGRGKYRLYRRGDEVHPSRRECRVVPGQLDVPQAYWDLWGRWQ